MGRHERLLVTAGTLRSMFSTATRIPTAAILNIRSISISFLLYENNDKQRASRGGNTERKPPLLRIIAARTFKRGAQIRASQADIAASCMSRIAAAKHAPARRIPRASAPASTDSSAAAHSAHNCASSTRPSSSMRAESAVKKSFAAPRVCPDALRHVPV